MFCYAQIYKIKKTICQVRFSFETQSKIEFLPLIFRGRKVLGLKSETIQQINGSIPTCRKARLNGLSQLNNYQMQKETLKKITATIMKQRHIEQKSDMTQQELYRGLLRNNNSKFREQKQVIEIVIQQICFQTHHKTFKQNIIFVKCLIKPNFYILGTFKSSLDKDSSKTFQAFEMLLS